MKGPEGHSDLKVIMTGKGQLGGLGQSVGAAALCPPLATPMQGVIFRLIVCRKWITCWV